MSNVNNNGRGSHENRRAFAIASDCDTFLTNDIALKPVAELEVLVLDEMET